MPSPQTYSHGARTSKRSFVSLENESKSAKYGLNKAVLNDFKIKIPKIGVQNQKMPQFYVGTNNDFERNSKLQFASVWYNISKGDYPN